MPKKRPSSEELGGDAERAKRRNQGVKPSQRMSCKEQRMLDPGLFVAQQQHEREQVSTEENTTVEAAVVCTVYTNRGQEKFVALVAYPGRCFALLRTQDVKISKNILYVWE